MTVTQALGSSMRQELCPTGVDQVLRAYGFPFAFRLLRESEEVRARMIIDQEVPGSLGQLPAGQQRLMPRRTTGSVCYSMAFMHRMYSLRYLRDVRRRTGLVLHIRNRGTARPTPDFNVLPFYRCTLGVSYVEPKKLSNSGAHSTC